MADTYARPRHHLSEGDLEFILDTLTETASARGSLLHLLADPEEIDRILDSERLFITVLESGGYLRLSTRLFFYLSVRRALRDRGMDDRDLADYLACMLAEFSQREKLLHPFGPEAGPMLLGIDYLARLEAAARSQQFHLHAAAGNHYLFMTSFFAAFIEKRRLRRGAPGVEYYQSIGRRSYAEARDHRLAREYDMAAMFDVLVHAFVEARLALSQLNAVWNPAA